MRKERNISLEKDLMTIGQDPMDEPDSSTTIELQKVVKDTERKLKQEPLNPPEPPKETKQPKQDKTPAKAYKPTGKPTKTVKPEPLPPNPYAPVKYDCDGKWRRLLAGIAIIGLTVVVIALLVGVRTYWREAVVGILVAFLMLPVYGWFDDLERDMAVRAVEKEYHITILQTAGGGNLADVRYTYGRNPAVKAGIVSYGHGLAWLRNVNGTKIIGRDKPLE